MAIYPKKFSAAGWTDYATGVPFPRGYDAWREVDQRNYENGRQRAANYRLATGRLPRSHVSQPAYLAAIAAVGPAFLDPKDRAASVPTMSWGTGQRQRRAA